jgi:hypothetical protein
VESWDKLGDRLMSTAPHAVSLGPDRLAVFAVGVDHKLYCRWREGKDWSDDWEELDGRVLAIAAPFAIYREPRRLDLFAVNFDHAIYRRWWNGKRWSTWEHLGGEAGGATITAPYAVSWGPKRLDLFVLGMDRGIWHKWWEGDLASEIWSQLAKDMISPPHAVSSGPGRIDIFAVGHDSELRHLAWRNGSWARFWESRRHVPSAPGRIVLTSSTSARTATSTTRRAMARCGATGPPWKVQRSRRSVSSCRTRTSSNSSYWEKTVRYGIGRSSRTDHTARFARRAAGGG